MGEMAMKSLSFGIFGLIVVAASAPAAAQQTYDLTLQATGPFMPPTGTGSFTIDALPPGLDLTGVFLQGPPGTGSPGNELTAMSFDFDGDIFNFSNEAAPGSAVVRFDTTSGDLTSIFYVGTDSSGDTLSINGLSYQLLGTNFSSIGVITASAVPEPASMTLITAALFGIVAVRRLRRP